MRRVSRAVTACTGPARATMLNRPEDIATFDRAFAVFWDRRGGGDGDDVTELPPEEVDHRARRPWRRRDRYREPKPRDRRTGRDAPLEPAEILRQRDFALYSPAEFVEARRLMDDLRFVGAARPSRRRKPLHAHRGHPRPAAHRPPFDPRRRRAGRTRLPQAGERSRRLVLLLDVSGSMEPYARAFVRFLHAAVVSRSRVEAFALGTRLTRVTRELTSRDPDAAVRAAAGRVVDWSGGTRLGEGVRRVQRRVGDPGAGAGRGRRGLLRRLGPRCARGTGRADGPLATRRVPHRVGQPAQGEPGVRAAGPGNGGGAAVC